MFYLDEAISTLPWFGPGLLIVLLASIVLGLWIGKQLQMSCGIAMLLLFSLGIILLVTLTPLQGWLQRAPEYTTRSCSFDPLLLPDKWMLRYTNDTSLNIILFIPLGLLCPLARKWKVASALFMGALLLPCCIEATQYALPILERVCSTSDIVNNLLGLFIGGVAGLFLRFTLMCFMRLVSLISYSEKFIKD